MDLFKVYSLWDIDIVRAEGSYVWDDKGTRYLDMYGGHAVISIGHTHPHYVDTVVNQLKHIGFYSNSVIIDQQRELADKLGELSGKRDYQLFLCNSGAEANENAMKLASFVTGKSKVIAMKGAFHGRTSLAVAATDNPNIVAPVNRTDNVIFVSLNDEAALEEAFKNNEISSVIVEAIQGVGGIRIASREFLRKIRSLCDRYNAVYIADEVQWGSTMHRIGQTSMPIFIRWPRGSATGFRSGPLRLRRTLRRSWVCSVRHSAATTWDAPLRLPSPT